jgi:flagellar protein FliJ
MARENALRRQQRHAAEHTRKVASIEAMMVDFERMAASLASDVAAEEERTRIKDPTHVAYSLLAKAVALRRSNLLVSTADLKLRLEAARRESNDAVMQLRALEEAMNAAPPAPLIATSPEPQNSGPLSAAS